MSDIRLHGIAEDSIVDGPFVKNLKSHALKWRGSSNQRVIDVQASLSKGEVVLWEDV